MTTKTLDADQIVRRARPITGQHAHEIQPFGHIVSMPIALSASVCKESVDNLNQLLADTITAGYVQTHHGTWSADLIAPSRSTSTPAKRRDIDKIASAFTAWRRQSGDGTRVQRPR